MGAKNAHPKIVIKFLMQKLSPDLRERLLTVFRKIDVDDSKTIDKEETLKYWYDFASSRKSNFAKINTDELFKEVDADNSGTIEVGEWLAFWESVKGSGYSEEEIVEEIESLEEGCSWVKFDVKAKKKP